MTVKPIKIIPLQNSSGIGGLLQFFCFIGFCVYGMHPSQPAQAQEVQVYQVREFELCDQYWGYRGSWVQSERCHTGK